MDVFRTIFLLPENYTGCCYIEENKGIYHYLKGLWHREDGPAIIFDEGSRHWFKNGMSHRIGGPAIENTDSDCCYAINDHWWWNCDVDAYYNQPENLEYKLNQILSLDS